VTIASIVDHGLHPTSWQGSFTIEEKALGCSTALSPLSSKYADEYRPDSASYVSK
jgi:hypothetical protein